MELRRLTPQDVPQLLAIQRANHPREVWETTQGIRAYLRSSPHQWGIIAHGKLVACILTHPGNDAEKINVRNKRTQYITDITVSEPHRGKGYATTLFSELVQHLGAKDIVMHCRATSYPVFSNPVRMRRLGYEIVSDKHLPGFYKRYGLAEDAHKLRLRRV